MADLALQHAIESSNMSPTKKRHLLGRYWDSAMGGSKSMLRRGKSHLLGGAHALRQGGESGIVGGVLGFAHAELPSGLDAKIGSMTHTVPLDAVVAAVGIGGAVLLSEETASTDLRNAGSAALAVFAFRKTHDWRAAQLAAKGVTPGSVVAASAAKTATVQGDFGEDPIVAIAQGLG